jgi:hypothetical protein
MFCTSRQTSQGTQRQYTVSNTIAVERDETINIGEIISESNKIYHIISSKPEDCFVSLSAKKNSEKDFQIIIKSEKSISENFEKYIYRQRTLQHLYIVNEFLKRKSNLNNYLINDLNNDILLNELFDFNNKEEKIIQENLNKFIQEIKQYIKNNNIEDNIEDNKFMKNLCDDIYISIKTFSTIYATMYNNSRQISQGTQRCYTVNYLPEELYENNFDNNIHKIPTTTTPTIVGLKRQITMTNNNNNINKINLFKNFIQNDYAISNYIDLPYLIRGSTEIMEKISYISK